MAPLVKQALLSLLCSGLSIAATWAVNKVKLSFLVPLLRRHGATRGAGHAQLVVQRVQHRRHLGGEQR